MRLVIFSSVFLYLLALSASGIGDNAKGLDNVTIDWLNETFPECTVLGFYADVENAGFGVVDPDGFEFEVGKTNRYTPGPSGFDYRTSLKIKTNHSDKDVSLIVRELNANSFNFARWSHWWGENKTTGKFTEEHIEAEYRYAVLANRSISQDEIRWIYQQLKESVKKAFSEERVWIRRPDLTEAGLADVCEKPFSFEIEP